MPQAQPDNTLSIQASFALQASEGEGKPRRFRIVANTGTPFRQWWSPDPCIIDLAGLDISAQQIPALQDHKPEPEYVVGQTDRVAIEAGQVICEGPIFPVTEAAETVLKLADAGYRWQSSVGAYELSMEFLAAGVSANVNGQEVTGPMSIVRKSVLREISFTVLGADRQTSAIVARHKGANMKAVSHAVLAAMTFEEWLVAKGFTIDDLDETQMLNMKALFEKDTGTAADDTTTDPATTDPATAADPAAPATDPVAAASLNPTESITAIRAENARIAAINAMCVGNPIIVVGTEERSLAAVAIEAGWKPADVQRRITQLDSARTIQASRGSGPYVISRSHERDCSIQALQASLIMRCGGQIDSPAYRGVRGVAANLPTWLRANINDDQKQQILEAGHRYSQFSMLELAAECARIDHRTWHEGTEKERVIRAALSGGTLQKVFTTSMNAVLLATYAELVDTTVGWTREADVTDFKEQERIAMQKGAGLKKLPRGNEADHITRADKYETYKIARYARQFQLDEQDFIDDSLGAFADWPIEMANGAGRLRGDLVYSILLRNPTMVQTALALFHATHGNLRTSSALTLANIKAAITTMQLLQENSVNLGIRATHVLVPPSLFHTAAEYLESPTTQIAGTAGSITERGTKNTAMGLAQVVSDERLENGLIDPDTETSLSGSATSWYVASTSVPTIEVGFLAGTGRAPRVETFTPQNGSWTLGWKIKHDIGAKAIDYRGLQKNTA